MYSIINEAWKHDPVKEITNKLSRGGFLSQNDHTNVFNFRQQNNSNQKNALSLSKDALSLSDNSLSLLSENTIGSNNSDGKIIEKDFLKGVNSDLEYGPFAPANLDKYPKSKEKKYHKIKHPSITSLNDITTSESDLIESVNDSKCDYSVKHLNKCDRCYYKLKRMIDNKVNKKLDELVLEQKMKQIQNMPVQTPVQPNPSSESWKETLIIVVGAIIAIFIIFLIVKCISK